MLGGQRMGRWIRTGTLRRRDQPAGTSAATRTSGAAIRVWLRPGLRQLTLSLRQLTLRLRPAGARW